MGAAVTGSWIGRCSVTTKAHPVISPEPETCRKVRFCPGGANPGQRTIMPSRALRWPSSVAAITQSLLDRHRWSRVPPHSVPDAGAVLLVRAGDTAR